MLSEEEPRKRTHSEVGLIHGRQLGLLAVGWRVMEQAAVQGLEGRVDHQEL